MTARVRAVLAVFAVEAIFAWMLAAPWAETFARTLGSHPDGDRALFWDPGMSLLLDVEHRLGAVFGALVASTAIGLAVYAVLSVLISGAFIAALNGDSLRRAIGRGAETYWRLFAIGAVTLFACVVLFVLVGVMPAYGLAQRASAPRLGLALAAIPIVFVAIVLLFIAALADLARARVVADDVSAIEALSAALKDRKALSGQAAATFPRVLASLGVLGYAAGLSTVAQSVFLIFLVHQLAAVARVALRGNVLSRALETVRAERPLENIGARPT